MFLVARPGPCDERVHPPKRTITPPYAGKHSAQPSHVSPVRCTEKLCRHANHWKCPVVIVSIPLVRRHGKRVSAALSVDFQSKSGVNFWLARRRDFWLWWSGKAWEDGPG